MLGDTAEPKKHSSKKGFVKRRRAKTVTFGDPSSNIYVEASDRELSSDEEDPDLGDIAQSVSGAATFRVGEEVVVFMARDKRGALHPVGMTQGVFHVDMRDSGAQELRRNLEAFKFINAIERPYPKSLRALKEAVLEAVQ